MRTLTQLRQLVIKELPYTDEPQCGIRARFFERLATNEGYKCRCVHNRGHVTNEVLIDGVWTHVEPSEPMCIGQQRLFDHIYKGPVVWYTHGKTATKQPSFKLGQYSQWLSLLKRRTNVLDPKTLFYELPLQMLLNHKRPNVIIRHDICQHPGAIMEMLHEENQLGIRSVIYMRPEDINSNEMSFWQEYQRLGWLFGLHITALDHHQMSEAEARIRYAAQRKLTTPPLSNTVCAHGYEGPNGEIPVFNNYNLEHEHPFGFLPVVTGHPHFHFRIADSCGVMYPGDPMRWIRVMLPRRLYYCLFHPQWYGVRNGWVYFKGPMAKRRVVKTKRRMNRLVTKVSNIYNDTDYFKTFYKPQVMEAAKCINRHGRKGDSVLDIGAGHCHLGVMLNKKFTYHAHDPDFNRLKAGFCLHQAMKRRLVNMTTTIPDKYFDWVVFIGWEGDAPVEAFWNAVGLRYNFGIFTFVDAESFTTSTSTLRYNTIPGSVVRQYFGDRIIKELKPVSYLERRLIVVKNPTR